MDPMPCPFCASDDVVAVPVDSDVIVVCRECGARGPSDNDELEHAVAA
jgi:hypothetical protein